MRAALSSIIFLLCQVSLTLAKAENEVEKKVLYVPEGLGDDTRVAHTETPLNLLVAAKEPETGAKDDAMKKAKTDDASEKNSASKEETAEKPRSKKAIEKEPEQQSQPEQQQEKPAAAGTTELDKLKEDALKAATRVGDVIKNAAENAANALNIAADGASTATKAVANSVQTAVQTAEQQIQTEKLVKAEAKEARITAMAEGKLSEQQQQSQQPAVHPWIAKAQEVVNGIAAGTAKAYEAVMQATGQQSSTGEQGGQQQKSDQKTELATFALNPDRVIDPSKDASVSRQVPRVSAEAQNIVAGSKVSELAGQNLVPMPSPSSPSPSPSPGHWTDKMRDEEVPETFTRYVAAKTFITWQDVLKGQKRLNVRSTVGFELLFPVRINEGGLNQEDNVVVDMDDGLKLKSELKYSHGLGEEVKMLNPLDSNYVEPAPSKMKEQATRASKIFGHLGKTAISAAGSPAALVGILLGVTGIGFGIGYASNLMQGKKGVRALPGVGRLVRAGGLQKYSQY